MVVKGNKVISEGMKEKRERKKDEEGKRAFSYSITKSYTKTTLGKEGERRRRDREEKEREDERRENNIEKRKGSRLGV